MSSNLALTTAFTAGLFSIEKSGLVSIKSIAAAFNVVFAPELVNDVRAVLNTKAVPVISGYVTTCAGPTLVIIYCTVAIFAVMLAAASTPSTSVSLVYCLKLV